MKSDPRACTHNVDMKMHNLELKDYLSMYKHSSDMEADLRACTHMSDMKFDLRESVHSQFRHES